MENCGCATGRSNLMHKILDSVITACKGWTCGRMQLMAFSLGMIWCVGSLGGECYETTFDATRHFEKAWALSNKQTASSAQILNTNVNQSHRDGRWANADKTRRTSFNKSELQSLHLPKDKRIIVFAFNFLALGRHLE